MKLSILILLVLAGVAWYANHIPGGGFAAISPVWIAPILFVAFLHFLIEPLRWQVYLRTHKTHKSRLIYFVFFCTGFLTYVLPAKLGLPLRYWLITRNLNLSGATTAVYLTLDTVLNILVWTIACLSLGGNLAHGAVAKNLSVAGYLAVGGILIGVFVVYRVRRNWLDNRFGQLRAAFSLVNPYSLAITSCLFFLEIAGFVVLHAIILAALSAPFIGWQAIATVTVFSMYAGFLTMLPMGLVGYDASVIFLLRHYDVGMENALMVPLIYRASILLISVGLGLPSSFKLGLGLNFKAIAAKASEKQMDQ